MKKTRITQFLTTIYPKISRGTLSDTEKSQLENIVSTYPCHLEATRLLIRAAWSQPELGFRPWAQYYLEALERESECWNDEDMIRLYSTGTELYGYDDEDELSMEAAFNAYNRKPDSWELLQFYVYIASPLLKEEEIDDLMDRLISLAGKNKDKGYKYYCQGAIYHRLAMIKNKKYKAEAIRHFEAALEHGLEKSHPDLARRVRIGLAKLRD